MLAGCALVAMLVVAGDPCHQLLRPGTGFVFSLSPEILGFVAAKRCGQSTTMEDLYRSILPHAVREAEII
jgi:hypothetical protein